MTQLATDPIREEHRQLVPHLRHVEAAATAVMVWDHGEAQSRLSQVLAFLRDDLLPHAKQEEDVLYPEIDRITGANTTATMTLDHVEIKDRIDRLGTTVETALGTWDDRESVGEVSRHLAALAAIVLLHFHKEEEALLPVLDDGLTVEEGHQLFSRMGHGHGHHEH